MVHLYLHTEKKKIELTQWLTKEGQYEKAFVTDVLLPHPSMGHQERRLFVLQMFMKAIMLRLVCGFCQFFINGFCKAGQFFLMF